MDVRPLLLGALGGIGLVAIGSAAAEHYALTQSGDLEEPLTDSPTLGTDLGGWVAAMAGTWLVLRELPNLYSELEAIVR